MGIHPFFRIFILTAILGVFCIGSAGKDAESASAATNQPESLGPYLPIWDDLAPNREPEVAYAPPDGYMVVWETDVDAYTYDIWARRLGVDGTPLGWYNVDSYPGIKLLNPAIAYNSQERKFLVVYERVVSSTDTNLLAKMVNWDGSGLSPVMYVAMNFNLEEDVDLVYNPLRNEFLAVFTQQSPSLVYEIGAARLSGSSGQVIDSKVIASSSSGVYRSDPAVAYNPARDRYQIAYSLEDTVTPRYAVVGRTMDANLANLSPEANLAEGNPPYIDISAAAGPDETLVAWSQGPTAIIGRRVGGDGTPLGAVNGFQLGANTNPGIYERHPHVVFIPGFGYLVVWDTFDGFTADEGDVYGRLVRAGSDGLIGGTIPFDNRENLQKEPALACALPYNCLVVYGQNPLDYPAGDLDISGRMLQFWTNLIPLILNE